MSTKRSLEKVAVSASKRLATSSRNTFSKVLDTGRVRILHEGNIGDGKGPVVYWMSRDMRIHDNWAFLYAQEKAIEYDRPLAVVFNVVPKFLEGTIRQFGFMLDGLEQMEKTLKKQFNIPMFLLQGDPVENISAFIERNHVSFLVTDFSPMRIGIHWRNGVRDKIDIAFHEVDACNVVPVWEASNKIEYAARTIRKRIHDKLDRFLVEYPKMVPQKVEWSAELDIPREIDWKSVKDGLEVDRSVPEVSWIKSGEEEAKEMLSSFIENRLKIFDEKRNDPTQNALSNLSPYIHFGQISAQTCALAVKKVRPQYTKSVDSFLEELIVRKELAENYVFYNPDGYDRLDGLYPQYDNNSWAQKTLNEHRNDKREFIYTLKQLEQSETHDDLWNAAQKEMVIKGKMHGFLRMYWCKKILEWTPSPEEALEYAIYLNDKYELDGRDPRGYVGCAWSIAGLHDQGWRERPVFGKIRFMNYKGCKNKFDVAAFVDKIARLKK